MTCLEKLCNANRWRVKTGKYASDETAGWNGVFLLPLSGELFNVQISDDCGWRHLSCSNAQRRALPSWEVMRRLRELFYDDSVWVVQFFPPQSEHVNEWCLHLWEPLNEKLAVPLYVME